MKNLLLCIICLVAVPALAQENEIVAHHAWAPATPGPTPTAAVYLVFHNMGDEAQTVVGLSCDLAEEAQIHETTMDDGMMSMQRLDSLEIPARAHVELKPGGMHVMLLGLLMPLVEGEKFSLRIELADGEVIEAEVLVGPVGAHDMPEGMDHDEMDHDEMDHDEMDHGEMNHFGGMGSG